uniref:Sulfotransferase domain-containing protein n=1 Tax=Romanomermis culicivorax TaxID=13658 RepID=A0A915IYB4_ROMCU
MRHFHASFISICRRIVPVLIRIVLLTFLVVCTVFYATIENFSCAKSGPVEIGKLLPNCLIIGARKSGTRALLEFLNLHNSIAIAREEVHFFDKDEFYVKGLDWYRNQMPPAVPDVKILIEKTPAYFVQHKSINRVYKFNPDIKLILILRNPVERLISDYTQVFYSKMAKNKTTPKLDALLFTRVMKRTKNKTKIYKEIKTFYKPLRNSMYAEHLKKWIELFPLKKNLHIVDGDRFVSDPLSELKLVEKFLNLSEEISNDSIYFNVSKGFYCYIHPDEGSKCLSESKGRKHVEISQETAARLTTFFKIHNEKLFQMINRRFSWY